MGFESFRVELCGGQATYSEVNEGLRKLEHITGDPDSVLTPGSQFFFMGDGKNVIEIELTDSPVKLSCRFTVCHPPAVDSAFLGLVKKLMVIFGMEVKIRDDVQPEHAHSFSLAQFHDFAVVISRFISARRLEWISAFGSKQVAATTNEVYKQIILPRCQTSIEKQN